MTNILLSPAGEILNPIEALPLLRAMAAEHGVIDIANWNDAKLLAFASGMIKAFMTGDTGPRES